MTISRPPKTRCFRRKDVEAAYAMALHALDEYRLWRDNHFVGHYLGEARSAYLSLLKNRAHQAIEDFRAVKQEDAPRQTGTDR